MDGLVNEDAHRMSSLSRLMQEADETNYYEFKSLESLDEALEEFTSIPLKVSAILKSSEDLQGKMAEEIRYLSEEGEHEFVAVIAGRCGKLHDLLDTLRAGEIENVFDNEECGMLDFVTSTGDRVYVVKSCVSKIEMDEIHQCIGGDQ
jgi:hypothetical protein